MTNIDVQHRGDYTAAVTDDNETASSLAGILTVLIPPVIVVHPQPATVVQGDFVTLGVLITNYAALPATYEWRLGSAPVQTNVVNAITNTLTFRALGTNSIVTNIYRVVVKNAANTTPGLASQMAAIIVLPDADGDHIPDGWETEYGFNPVNAADAFLDSDGDGMTTWQEFIAGTDPRDPQNYLKLEAARDGNGAVLSFNATSNKTYTVLFLEELGGVTWPVVTNISAAPTNRLIRVTPPTGQARRYYRLVTPQQP